MTTEITLFSAFLTGLLGSVHCIGMCSGIVGALTLSLPPSVRHSYTRLFFYIIAYNSGRIASYSLAGLFAGFLGAQFLGLLPIDNPHQVAKWVSGLFMLALGLYIGQWWKLLHILEKLGSHLWRKIEPLGHRFLPITHELHALALGLVWGWLPCGLVYSALVLALTTGEALSGARLMLAFGIGTLPMLMMMGTTAQWLIQATRHLIVQQVVGATIFVLGLYIVFTPMPHHH